MSKSAKKRRTASATHVSALKTPQQANSNRKRQKSERGSKQSQVIAMLQSPTGTTIAAMMKATGWQQHSVRGFLAGVVRKRLKLNLASQKVDGDRTYKIAGGDEGKATSRKSDQRAA